MRLRIVLLCSTLLLTASLASAFPLSGGNGQINATVLGTYVDPAGGRAHEGETEIHIDLLFDYRGSDIEGASDYRFLKLHLVDSDDKFQEPEPWTERIGSGSGQRELLSNKIRMMYTFSVPPETEIKRLRITPPESRGPPFSIDWVDVPEVTGMPITMKFYSINQISSLYEDYLSVDVKLTNNNQTLQTISSDQFVLIDQFGFPYGGGIHEDEEITLLPSESMRFSVRFEDVSKLSRPVYLQYAPSNLTMDISAWA